MTIDIIPTGAAVGAEIRGVDLAPGLDDAAFEAIDRAYNDHGVIYFRNQTIEPEGLLALTERFGDLQFNTFGETLGLEGWPGIVLISNIEEGGRGIGVKRAGEYWHSDMCYTPKPPRGTILNAREVPELNGLPLGDTCFAGTHAAYDALPDAMKKRLAGLMAVFDFAGRKRAVPITQAQIDAFPPVTHPMVRTHPHTGRKCLYVMRDDCTGIVGFDEAKALPLIDALADHIVRPEFVYRHAWRRGDVLIWDNCTVQHMAIQDYELPLRRLMYRTTFAADSVPA